MRTMEILAEVDWFSNVGQPLLASSGNVIMVSDWGEAVTRCSDTSWEFVCTDSRNELTMHLNRFCKAEFQCWNEVVADARHRLAEHWKRMRSKLEYEGLPSIVASCVEWDTMHAVACEHYAAWNPPQFFERLLTFYECGHFPCGWSGDWPVGKLQVF